VPSVTRPLRKDAERNRRRILEAAREVFAARGLGVSLDEIAHHAGVGVGTVYRRFPDKEALIDALFEQRVADFAAMAAAARRQEDPWEGLVGFLVGAVGMQAEDRGLKELLLSSEHGRTRVASVRGRIGPIVGEVVERAKAAGVLREDVMPHDVPLINMMLGTVADAARDTSPELWRRYLGLVLDGLRPAREAPTPLPQPAPGDEVLDSTMQAWRPPRR
jgi:AcrR family transcriptional regulator